MDENRLETRIKLYVNDYAKSLRKRADEDYIAARMCYFHHLRGNFLWNGQQCIEKYLKAIALFQDIDVSEGTHDLKKLFDKVNEQKGIEKYLKATALFKEGHDLQELFKKLNKQQCIEKYLKETALFQYIDVLKEEHDLNKLFEEVNNSLDIIKFSKKIFPRKIEGTTSKYESYEDFLKRLTFLGMDRYCTYSWCLYGDELIKLDAAVFIIRRYCTPIDTIIAWLFKLKKHGIRNLIDENSHYSINDYLGQVIHKDKHIDKRCYLLKYNSFFPTRRDIKAVPVAFYAFNHVLARRYENACRGSDDDKRIFIGLAEKLLERIYFNESTKRELKKAITEFKNELEKSCPGK